MVVLHGAPLPPRAPTCVWTQYDHATGTYSRISLPTTTYMLPDGVHRGIVVHDPHVEFPGLFRAMDHLAHLGDGPSDNKWYRYKEMITYRLIHYSTHLSDSKKVSIACDGRKYTGGDGYEYMLFKVKHVAVKSKYFPFIVRSDDKFAIVPNAVRGKAIEDVIAHDIAWI